MSIKSDEPFEIPVFLRNPTNRGGLRLPRTTEFRMKDEEPAPDADTDASPDVYAGEGSPMAPVSVLAPSHRLRAVLMPVAAFAVAMSAAVFVVRLPAFEALVSGRVAHASAPAQSAKSEPSPSSFLQSALTAAAANPPEAPAPWSHQAAQLQRDGLDDPATPPAPASVAVPIVAPSPEPLAATLVADAPVAAETSVSASVAVAASTPPLAPVNPPAVSPAQAGLGDMVADTTPAPSTGDAVIKGVSDREIRFGMVSPFTGANKEAGRQLKLGVDVAFAQANDAGGVNGRLLKLLAVDDGYEPSRTLAAMQELYEKDDVFGFIGNFGTATAAVSVPYALDHRALFLGALSGGGLLRRDPPDRYVFNYRPSYSEETGAALRYLVKVRRIAPTDIAVFTQMDPFGDAGYDGVAKAMRSLPDGPDKIMRIGYKRNSIDVQDAIGQLRAARGHIKAVIMVATYRAAAKFIEKSREAIPGLIYTNVSAVGATSLADELMLLGPRYADGVVVTQVTPAVGSSASFVLKYKAALAKYFPGEAPDYSSLESYIDADILIEALKRAGRQIDTEKLIDTMESMKDLDFGIGTVLRFSGDEHQGSHKVWGTQLDANGQFQPIDLE